MAVGKQVLLYLVDGGASGLRTAEIANWTGHLVAAPRSDLGKLLAREEPRRTGVYLLLGDDADSPQAGGSKVYVGEGDEVASRLKKHQAEKDWWTWVVVITSQAQAQQLTKSQVRYLESQLITQAKASAQATVANATDPGFAKLSEAETSNMAYFLDQLSVLLPAIGVTVFESASTPSLNENLPTLENGASPLFEMTIPKHGVSARARVIDGQFWVLKDSLGAPQAPLDSSHSPGTAAQYSALRTVRDALVASGALVEEGDRARFAKDVLFSSPSRAASVVQGARSANGRVLWVGPGNVTYGQWEARDLPADAAE